MSSTDFAVDQSFSDREATRAQTQIRRSTHRKHGRKGNMAEDQQLMCSDCGQAFTFTAEDQDFFRERGYSSPKRCKACRQAKKNEQAGGGWRRIQRSTSQGTSVICSGCGQQTTVPFEPRGTVPCIARTAFRRVRPAARWRRRAAAVARGR